ncbi:MAG TPA: SDR family oxidoreductase [Puia sp.]|jgi:NAD(P)-dependent dehydrogenase (short-subunit alcohol dehydrogenase family)
MANSIHSLSGKRVILLGGSSGIGLATAKAAASEGAAIVIVSGNAQRLEQALSTLPAGSEAKTADLAKEENIQRLFNSIGSFDHLVYTAGENISLGNIADTEIEQARQFFTIRYWGAFAAVKYGAPHINPGGSVNLTSGIASTRPGKGWSVASSICGAMEGFVRAAAVELAPIRVNSVVPGVVKTNLWNSLSPADRDNLYTNVGNALLVRRVGEAEDIARTFVYLMTQSFGTGQNIVIDGGSVLV